MTKRKGLYTSSIYYYYQEANKMKKLMHKIRNGLVGSVVAGSALLAPYFVNNYRNIQNNTVQSRVASDLTKSPLESKVSEHSGPIKECRPSWNDNTEAKTALCLQIEEFEDQSKTSIDYETDGKILTYHYPQFVIEDNWIGLVNPFYKDETISDEKIRACQTHIPGQERKFLTDDPVLFGKDRILYAIFKHPGDIFHFLYNWNGPKVDRLIINAHGSSRSLGQNVPEDISVDIDELLMEYSPKDFAHVMSDRGNIFLKACETNMNYQSQLTMAETISWLFDSPVQGSIAPRTDFYKTVYPRNVKEEVQAYLLTRKTLDLGVKKHY